MITVHFKMFEIDITDEKFRHLAITIYTSFILTSAFVITVIVCCGKKKQPDPPPGFEIQNVDAKSAVAGSTRKIGSPSKSDKDLKSAKLPDLTEKSAIGKLSKIKSAKEIALEPKKVTRPPPPTDTVPRQEYGTLRGIENKLEATQIAKPSSLKKVEKKVPKDAVGKFEYATLRGIGDKLEPSDKEISGGSGGEAKGEKYVDVTPVKQQSLAKKSVHDQYVQFETKGAVAKEAKEKKQVGSQAYGTMAAAPDKALTPSVVAKAPKGKVGADAYGTMQIANKNALSPSFIAKKGEPKKFAAGGAYGTMMGIGDKMVASKQK